MKALDLTAERLRALLQYDPETGRFTRLQDRHTRFKAGSIAGCLDGHTGYCRIRIDDRLHHAHRLAVLYMTGEWPKHEVDHKNGCRSDNRWSNLRDVTSSVNKENLRRARADNKCGDLGVCLHAASGLWLATIRVDGIQHCLGYRKSQSEARQLYLDAKRHLHVGCTI